MKITVEKNKAYKDTSTYSYKAEGWTVGVWQKGYMLFIMNKISKVYKVELPYPEAWAPFGGKFPSIKMDKPTAEEFDKMIRDKIALSKG